MPSTATLNRGTNLSEDNTSKRDLMPQRINNKIEAHKRIDRQINCITSMTTRSNQCPRTEEYKLSTIFHSSTQGPETSKMQKGKYFALNPKYTQSESTGQTKE